MEERLVEKMTSLALYFVLSLAASRRQCHFQSKHNLLCKSQSEMCCSLLITSQASVFSSLYDLTLYDSHPHERAPISLRMKADLHKNQAQNVVQCIPGLRVLHITSCHFIIKEQFTQKVYTLHILTLILFQTIKFIFQQIRKLLLNVRAALFHTMNE